MESERLTDASDECFGIKLGAEDFVGAVRVDGNTPVAHKCDKLFLLGGLDLGAKPLGLVNTGVAFDINQHEIEVAGPKG
jgi:hypothetical protein